MAKGPSYLPLLAVAAKLFGAFLIMVDFLLSWANLPISPQKEDIGLEKTVDLSSLILSIYIRPPLEYGAFYAPSSEEKAELLSDSSVEISHALSSITFGHTLLCDIVISTGVWGSRDTSKSVFVELDQDN